jgi:hypothetical protein
MCLNETYSTVWVSIHLSDTFSIRNGLKQGDALLPFLFNCALEYTISKVRANQEGMKLNDTRHIPNYASDVNILGESIHTIKKNKEALKVTSKEIGLEVNAEKLSMWSHLETSVQDEVTPQRQVINHSKG